MFIDMSIIIATLRYPYAVSYSQFQISNVRFQFKIPSNSFRYVLRRESVQVRCVRVTIRAGARCKSRWYWGEDRAPRTASPSALQPRGPRGTQLPTEEF
ncbi:hypothetical protein RR46_06327 [Papilio xuthus]|uniref:Uncharacterized protein n=1 Tax=Papilio xuthus TaxID=66420 RepID=A0A194QCM3_PAPXU|nr:hypothetical protein RR46_06327 [Papilio xuthus]